MLSQLKTITTQIGDALSMPVNPANQAQVSLKINKLTTLLASSCQAVALSEMLLSRKLLLLTEDSTWASLTATDKKMVFAGRSRTEAYYATLAERQNKAIVHTLECLRVMLL